MSFLVISLAAVFASGLTFLSGFGLGTLLFPAFALFVPVDQAIAMTAVVHLVNSLVKVALVGRQADRAAIFRFGLPAIAAAAAAAVAAAVAGALLGKRFLGGMTMEGVQRRPKGDRPKGDSPRGGDRPRGPDLP